VAHYNIRVTKDLFNASLSSWKNDWLLDRGETFTMNFRRDFFEEFTNNVNGASYFVDKSKLKPSSSKYLVFHTFFCMMFYISQSRGETCCLWYTSTTRDTPFICMMERFRSENH